MASAYKQDEEEKIESLLSRLVGAVADLKPESATHRLALDYCHKTLKHHRFGGTSPSDVDNNYDKLAERFVLHAQLAKRDGFLALRDRFMKQCLPLRYPDPHHRLLSALYWLQRLPLQSMYDPAGLAALDQRSAHVPGTVAADEQDKQDYLEEVSDWEEASSCYGSDSELSDWGSTGSESGEGLDRLTPKEDIEFTVTSPAPERANASDRELVQHQKSQSEESAATMAFAKPHHVPAPYTRGCLMDLMATTRAAGMPQIIPPPEACTSEQDLVWELLRALRGIAGKTLQLQGGAFIICPGAHMPHLSTGALRSVLSDFVNAGNQMLRLRQLIECATTTTLLTKEGRQSVLQTPVTPTMSALCVQMNHFIDDCFACVENIEMDLEKNHEAGIGARMTLLEARKKLSGVLGVIQFLDTVATKVVPASYCTAMESSAAILTGLYRMLEDLSLGADHESEAILLRLLVGAMQPYTHMLHSWLMEGVVDDAWQEFFITPQQETVTSPTFWNNAFTIRRGASAAPGCNVMHCVPCFLEEAAESILAAGKSVHLIANMDAVLAAETVLGQDGKHKRVMVAAAAGAAGMLPEGGVLRLGSPLVSGGASFYDTFMHLLHKFINRTSGTVAKKQPTLQDVLPDLFCLTTATGGGGDINLNIGEGDGPASLKSGVRHEAALTSLSWALPNEQGNVVKEDSGFSSSLSMMDHGFRELQYAEPSSSLWASLSESNPALSLVSLLAYTGMADACSFLGAERSAKTGPSSSPQLGWLNNNFRLNLPPPHVLIRRCLLEPINQQVEISSMELLGQLLGPWGLMRELRVLKGFFLMGSPALEGFMSELFPMLMESPWNLRKTPPYELELVLKETLPSETTENPMPHPDKLSVVIEPKPIPKNAVAACQIGIPHVRELEILQFHYKVTRPLELVIDNTILEVYNDALVFLLQVRWAKHALEDCRMSLFRRVRGAMRRKHSAAPSTIKLLDTKEVFRRLQDMVHFVTNLHQYVVDRNLFASWADLEKDLDHASSLDDVIRCHAAFLRKVEIQCLLVRSKEWKLLQDAVLETLSHILQWCHVLKGRIGCFEENAEALAKQSMAEKELKRLNDSFDNHRRYLMRVLNVKTVKIGGYHGLEHLLMRLTYNDWTGNKLNY